MTIIIFSFFSFFHLLSLSFSFSRILSFILYNFTHTKFISLCYCGVNIINNLLKIDDFATSDFQWARKKSISRILAGFTQFKSRSELFYIEIVLSSYFLKMPLTFYSAIYLLRKAQTIKLFCFYYNLLIYAYNMLNQIWHLVNSWLLLTWPYCWGLSHLLCTYINTDIGNKILSLHKMLQLKKVEYDSQEIYFKVIILQWLSALVVLLVLLW